MVSSDEADALEVSVELVYRELLAKKVCEELSHGEKEALPQIAEAYSKMRQVVESSVLASPSIFQACLIVDGNPQFDIPHQQLEDLIITELTVPEIAKLVGVSLSTI